MKMLVTSDLHLSDKIWKHRPIEGDSYYSWRQIVDLAIDQDCKAVTLAGDILDKQINLSRPVKELTSGLSRLSDARLEVYYNQGQHEYQSHPWMSLNESTVWLQQDMITTAGGHTISGCDYQDADGLLAFLKTSSARESDVLVCHQVWLEFMGEECKPQGSFADIPGNVSYLITGDYHEHICQKFGNLTVLSPGSTHLRSISEPEDKFIFFVEFTDAGKVKIKSHPLITRRKFEIDLVKNPSFETAASAIEGYLGLAEEYADEHHMPEVVRKPLMRLVYPKDEVDLCNKVTKLVGDRAHMFYKQVKQVSAESLDPQLVNYVESTDRVNMSHCLDTFIDKKKQPKTHSLASKLLSAPDPEQALHRWVKEQVNDGS